jgi:cupin 2 domain-containing protein
MRHTASADGNLFDALPSVLATEELQTLVATGSLRLVRIVSTGQASPPEEWYDQPDHEWVVLLKGAAAIRFEDEDSARTLGPGDFLSIPAHVRHRVEWTAASEPTVWLALHYG